MNQRHCLNDDRVGPLVVGCRDNFDFTKTFEQLALSIVPNVSFLVIAVTRIAKLSQASARGTLAHRLRLAKTLTAAALLGLHCAYLNFLLAQSLYGGRYDVFAAALATSSTAVLALLHMRLAHALPPDAITVFLSVSVICEAVQLRTHWLSAAPGCLTGSLAAITALTPVLLALELTSKSARKGRLGPAEDETNPRSALGNVFLWWLNDLVRHAYRHDVGADDLGPLEDGLAAERYRTRFMTRYRAMQCKEASRGNNTRRGWKVVRALLRALGGSCAAPVLPRIIMSAFKFAHPFFIGSILGNLSQATSHLAPGTAVAYVGIVLFLNVGTAMATSTYGYFQERAVAQVRSCLVPALYQKTVRRRVYSEKSAAVLSMINSEMNMIQFGVRTAHEFWICVVETILGCWLLQRRIGWAFLAPLAVELASAGASTISGRFTAKRQGAWMDALGSRVGLISPVLPNLPSIKMAGLGNQIGRIVQMSREREIGLGNRFRLLSTASATFAFVPMIFCPIVTFTVARRSLTMSEVMTSLAFINLLSNPMIHLLQCIPFVMAAVTSIGRVEEFLDSDNDDGQVPVSYRDDVESGASSGVVELVEASFGWIKDEWSVHNINLSMPAGSFQYIVGPVAAGKTTFCLGLLDEVKHTSGQVSVRRGKQLSYCSQDVFIINGTIRENIVGFAPFKAPLYEKVVDCCQLQADFASLANGDETIVGSQGTALSGGQKKRISLARSLYAEPEVAIFDDVLSGVDMHTAESIARQVFGPEGILRKSNTTVIFASQSTEFVDYFDESFVLKEGIVTWSGSPRQLPTEVRSDELLPVTKKRPEIDAPKDRTDFDERRKPAKNASGTLPMVPPGHSDDYSFYFAAVGPFTFLIFFLLAVASTFLFTFSTLWLELWVAEEGDLDRERFYFRTFWALQVTCLVVLLVYFTYTSNVMGPKASSKLHFGALKTIVLAPLDYYTTVDSSVPTGYMSQDMNIIDSQFTNSVGNTVASIFITFFQFILIALGSPAVLVGYPIFTIVLFQVQRIFVRAAVQLRAMALEGCNPLNKYFKETLDGLATIRAFGWIDSSIRLNDELVDKSQQSSFISAMLQTCLKTMLNLCIAVVAAIFVCIASRLPSSTGLVGVALVTLISAGEMIGNVIQSYTALQTSAVALNRLKFLQDEVPREDEPERDVSVDNWRSEGTIQLDAVSAAYRTSKPYPGKELSFIEGQDPDDALKALSLSIKKGETTLICGRTGSGKSTLLLLLQGFIVPHSGSVTVDGIAPARVDRNKLRDGIIALPQFPFFLTDEYTVRDNLEHHFNQAELSLADIQQAKQLPPQDEDCVYALQTVGLWDAISARGGLDAPVKEGSLSRGQKQLFSLARAILRQRRRRRVSQGTASEGGGLLLLDEFNTGLDSSTESLMWEAIKTEFACCTIICVAHRLGAASDFDHVVVLSHGRIVEEGAPSTLLADSDGKFRAIWSMNEI